MLNRCLDKPLISKQNMRFVIGFFKSALSVVKTVQIVSKIQLSVLLFSACIGTRHIVTFMLFLGMANAYVMRTNMSVAIVAMVNHTALPKDNTVLDDECDSDNSSNSWVAEMSKHSPAVRKHFISLKMTCIFIYCSFETAMQRNDLPCFCSCLLYVMLMKLNSAGIQPFPCYAGDVLLEGNRTSALNLQFFLFEKLREETCSTLSRQLKLRVLSQQHKWHIAVVMYRRRYFRS